MWTRQHQQLQRSQLIHTANELCVSEFRVFELAYRVWFGEPGELRTLKCHFVDYVLCGDIPVWVRHYVRKFCKDHPTDGAVPARDPRDLFRLELYWFGVVLRSLLLPGQSFKERDFKSTLLA